MKKLISIMLSVLIIVSCFTVLPIVNATSFNVIEHHDNYEVRTNNDWEYSISFTKNTIVLDKYIGNDTIVTLPATVDDCPVYDLEKNI
jgi:hypothetical protein